MRALAAFKRVAEQELELVRKRRLRGSVAAAVLECAYAVAHVLAIRGNEAAAVREAWRQACDELGRMCGEPEAEEETGHVRATESRA